MGAGRVLLWLKMKTRICLFLGLAGILGVIQAAEKTSPLEALRLLRAGGYIAKPHYNGIPDTRAIYEEASRTTVNRKSLKERMGAIVIPEIKELEGFTMTEFMTYLDDAIRKNDPTKLGVNLIINPNLTPGGASVTGGGAAAAVAPAPAGGAVAPAIDPATGLPLAGGAPGMPAAGGIDPVTGLPIQGQGAGNAGGGGNGPSVGGSAFNPDDVKIVGLKTKMKGLTVLQIIDAVTQSFDTPIQYVIVDHGVMFLQKPANQVGYFTRILRLNPNAFSQGLTQTTTGAGTGAGGAAGGGPGGGLGGGGIGGGPSSGGGGGMPQGMNGGGGGGMPPGMMGGPGGGRPGGPIQKTQKKR